MTPQLKGYDGILIGTGIKIGMWTKPIKKLVKSHTKELNNRDYKLGLFISCGTASKKESILEAIDKYITKKVEKFGLTLDLYDAFGPAYDLREESKLGKMSRLGIADALKNEEKIDPVEKKLYDFRDWEQIQKFIDDFESLL